MSAKSLHTFPDGKAHGVIVSTLDFESSDPSSNLGGTLQGCASSRDKLYLLLQFPEMFYFNLLITLNIVSN